MLDDITREVTYDLPIDRVWAALTDSDALEAWLMPNDFKPVVGHRFTLRTRPAPFFDGTVHAEVVELDPPHRMVWSWVGGPVDTTVTFVLESLGERRTRLRFSQTGFSGTKALMARVFLASGWRSLLGRDLPRYVRTAA